MNLQGNQRAHDARTSPSNHSQLVPIGSDYHAALHAAARLFDVLGVLRDVGTVDLAAQAILAQARDWGGIELAAEQILVAANEAKAAGERRWRFWFLDGGYLGKSAQKAPNKREAGLLKFRAQRQKLKGGEHDSEAVGVAL